MTDRAGRKSPLRRLLTQGGIYALGNLAVKASGLLLAPLYLNEAFFSQAAFGHLVVLEATAQLLIPIVGLGLATGMLKFMADPELKRDASAIPLTTLVLTVAAAAIFVAILWPFAPVVAGIVLDEPETPLIARLLLMYVAFKVIGYVPFTLIRLRERAGVFVAAMIVETLLLIGGVYLALAVLDAGLLGVMIAYAASAGGSALILTIGMLATIDWQFRVGFAYRLVAFGAPLVLAGIALPILHVGDRYVMEWLSTTEELAVYGWAARLSGILNMLVVQSFQLAFAVVGIKELGSAEGGLALHRRTYRHYVVWSGWAALGLSLVAHDLTDLLSGTEAYLLAAPMVLPLSLGLVLFGLYVVATNVLYAEGKTRIVATSVFAAAGLNIAANIALIPWLGGMGAALATLVSYGALGLVTLRMSERYRAAGYRYRVVAVVCCIVAVLWFGGYLARDLGVALRLATIAGMLAAYPIAIIVLGVYGGDEVGSFVTAARRYLVRQKEH